MAAASPCPDRESLERLLLGLLSEDEAAALASHVEGCAACLRRMRGLRTDDRFLDDLRSSTRPLDWDAAVNTALLARVCRLEPTPGTGAEPTPSAGPADEKAPEDPPETGPVGAYRLLRLLGQGGMGVVYLARHERLKRTVALKMIHLGSRAHPERLARFRRETELIARLRHGNVVPIYEAGEHEGRPFLALEYVEGGTLAQKLVAGPLPVRTIAEVTEALARGVYAAHECGVVHRDLKPANVLLAADGTPRITDFGLARALAPGAENSSPEWDTQSGAILGTPSYMAPEQLSDSREAGPAADVYALGAILYECLTGRPPFRAATPLETLEQVRGQEPVSPRRLQPGVPRDLETICLRCLHKEPRRRYASALALADDLRRYLDGKPVLARPTPVWERVWKWARRRPAPAALGVVSALALTGLIGGALVYERRLRAALAQSEAHRERADANYRRARATVQRMLGRLEGGRLQRVPQLRELWQEQLEDALAFYQGSLHELDSPSPAVRRDVAEAYEATAAIQAKLGRLEAAAENYRQALALLQGLADEPPEDPAYRGRLAACANALGRVYLGTGRLEDAAACQQQAIALADELARRLPAVSRQEELAQYHHDLANVYRHQKRWEQAEVQYREALALRERLPQQRPPDRRSQAALAESYAHLTNVYQQLHRYERAGETFRKAESVLGPLVRDFPEELELALELAQLYVSVVPDVPVDPQGTERGLAAYVLITEAAEAALQREPHLLVARQALVAACNARGLLLHRLQRYAEALRDWDRAVELADEPLRSTLRGLRAASLAATGDHRRAAAEAGALAAREQLPTGDLYNLACVYAVCLGAALRDANLSPAERRQQGEEYAARALALLRRVNAAGGLAPLGWYKVDPDLDPLRERADFRKFLEEVEPGR